MNGIAKQLRSNADAILIDHAKDNIPAAAIAGTLQMAADEIDRLEALLQQTKQRESP